MKPQLKKNILKTVLKLLLLIAGIVIFGVFIGGINYVSGESFWHGFNLALIACGFILPFIGAIYLGVIVYFKIKDL